MKKLILVTPGIRFNPMGVPVLSVNGTYMNAIAAAGGIPVMLGSTPLAEEYAEMAAGLVITGGESVHPTRYGETFMHLADNDPAIAHNLKAGCNSVRDEMEFAAFEAFFRRKKPILGICRGHQLVNAATGGANMLNFPRKHAVEHSEGIAHDVLAEPGSASWSTASTGTAPGRWGPGCGRRPRVRTASLRPLSTGTCRCSASRSTRSGCGGITVCPPWGRTAQSCLNFSSISVERCVL